MAHIIALANQKGGVGKTTSAINIGAALAEQSHSVLLVDFDPQGNLSSGLNIEIDGNGVYEVLSGEADIDDAIQHTTLGGLHVVGTDINLSGAAVELKNDMSSMQILKEKLAPCIDRYDYILLDSPPSLGILTVNVLSTAQQVIIPLQCEYFALEGLKQLLKSIQSIKQRANSELKIMGILCTMYDSRTKLGNEVINQVVTHFKQLVFKGIIPRNTRLAEAPSHGQPIATYDKYSIGAESYRVVAAEVLQRAEG